MRIWWCQEHGQAEDGEGLCHRGRVLSYRGTVLSPDKTRIDHFEVGSCRMVPMRLIPDNAETVARVARVIAHDFGGSRWPVSAVDRVFAEAILAALDGETP